MRVPGWHALGGSAAFLMMLGTGSLALGAYMMLACANRSLSPTDYGHLSVYWTGFLIGGGALAVPLEALLVRVSGTGREGVTLAGARRARFVMAALAVVTAGLLAGIAPSVFGRPGMIGATLAVLSWIFVSPERGRLLTSHRFGGWCVQTSVEGIVRAGVSIALLLLGINSDAVWSLAILIPVLASGLSAWLIRSTWLVPQRADPDSRRSLAWLVSAGFGQQVMLNAGPILVTVGTGALPVASAGLYLNTLSIARAPQLPILGVQGAWAPRFGARAAVDPVSATGMLKAHLKSAGLLLLVLSAGCVALSPVLMRLLTGQSTVLLPLLVTLLLATVLTSYSQSMTLAANALGREHEAAVGWLATAGFFVVGGLAAPGIYAIAAANVLAVGVLAGLLSLALWRALAGPR